MNTKPIYGYRQYPHMVFYWMHHPDMDIKRIIASNLAARMAESPSLDTLKKLSARSGVSYGTIQRARSAEANLTLENLAGIASAFGCTVADLITPADNLFRSANGNAVQFAAESRRDYVVSWPFQHVSQSAYDSLTDEGKLWVQGRLDATIEQALQQFGTQAEKQSA